MILFTKGIVKNMAETKKEIYERSLYFVKNSQNSKRVTIYSELVNLLYNSFPDMDWVGFYEKDEEKDELYLSIYVGSEACEIIPTSKGVCGKCFTEGKTQLVEDVHLLPYHIACSSSTKSEIVVPVFRNKNCVAVLDIDSDKKSTFDDIDQKYLEEIVGYLI